MHAFYGEPTGRISNQFITVEYLMNGGPHIPRVVFNRTEENLFAETPGFDLKTQFGIYHFRGGHRFCHAPESIPRTYIPDNDGVSIEMQPDGVDLIGPIEAGSGIQKSLSLKLSADQALVSVTHQLKNCNPWPVETAPWGISMLPLGGTAFLPIKSDALISSLSIWSYSHWNDPRLKIIDDFVVINALAAKPALKVGHLNGAGWLAYLKKDVLFIKRFKPEIDRIHPDHNVNAEIYIEDKCIELESLAALEMLQPGQRVEHVEVWQWISGISKKRSLTDTALWINALVEESRPEEEV
jgi:hypothetical protein